MYEQSVGITRASDILCTNKVSELRKRRSLGARTDEFCERSGAHFVALMMGISESVSFAIFHDNLNMLTMRVNLNAFSLSNEKKKNKTKQNRTKRKQNGDTHYSPPSFERQKTKKLNTTNTRN